MCYIISISIFGWNSSLFCICGMEQNGFYLYLSEFCELSVSWLLYQKCIKDEIKEKWAKDEKNILSAE